MHAALDAGVTLIDTADAYAYDEAEFGHNEELVARALRSYGAETTSSWRPRAGTPGRAASGGWTGRRRYLRRACEASLRRLRRRRDRALPVPPPRPRDAVGGVDGRRCVRCSTTAWSRMVGISNADVAADRRGPGHRRRRAGERAEPVLAGVPVLGRGAGALRGARSGVDPVEPVRRCVPRSGSLDAGGARVRRGGRRAAGRLGVPGDAGVAPRAGSDVVLPIPAASSARRVHPAIPPPPPTSMLTPEQLAHLTTASPCIPPPAAD